MLIFLHGEDTFRSQQKLNSLIKTYQQKNKGSIITIESEHFSHTKLKMHLYSNDLFTKQKLIIIKNILGELQPNQKEQEQIISLLQSVAQNTAIIFYERGKVDEKTSLVTYLLNLNKSNTKLLYEEFKLPSQGELYKWIGGKLKEANKTIDHKNLMELVSSCSNTWDAYTETQKLSAVTSSHITSNIIEALTLPKIDDNIFHFIDALCRENLRVALSLLNQQLTVGREPIYLLTMIARHIKILIKIKSAIGAFGFIDSRNIANKIKEHPYVVQKALKTAENASHKNLCEMYQHILTLDKLLKTTRIPPSALLTKLIYDIISLSKI